MKHVHRVRLGFHPAVPGRVRLGEPRRPIPRPHHSGYGGGVMAENLALDDAGLRLVGLGPDAGLGLRPWPGRGPAVQVRPTGGPDVFLRRACLGRTAGTASPRSRASTTSATGGSTPGGATAGSIASTSETARRGTPVLAVMTDRRPGWRRWPRPRTAWPTASSASRAAGEPGPVLLTARARLRSSARCVTARARPCAVPRPGAHAGRRDLRLARTTTPPERLPVGNRPMDRQIQGRAAAPADRWTARADQADRPPGRADGRSRHWLLCAVCVRGGCRTPPPGPGAIERLLKFMWAYPFRAAADPGDIDVTRAHYLDATQAAARPPAGSLRRRQDDYVWRRKGPGSLRVLGLVPNTVMPAYHAYTVLFARQPTLDGILPHRLAPVAGVVRLPARPPGLLREDRRRAAGQPAPPARTGREADRRGLWAMVRPRTRTDMRRAKEESARHRRARRLYIRPNHCLCILCNTVADPSAGR